jgi:glucokinase
MVAAGLAAKPVIGVDVGGTKILAGLVAGDGTVGHRRERRTPVGSQDELVAALDAAVSEFLGEGPAAIGFGVPSTIDYRTGRVESSVNIPLEQVDLAATMSKRFGVPVTVENDANAAALAEARAGAGRDARTMVMLTLGTGCGGGVVIEDRLFRGWAEFGHMVIEFDGIPCQGDCTGFGHLEPYVTGLAAAKLAQEQFGAAADAHRLVRLANEGDDAARSILTGIGRRLGAGIGSLVNVFDPDVVVIGGGFGTAAAEHLFEPALDVARREALPPAKQRFRLLRAELGTAAGVIGAGLVAHEAA